MAVITATFFPAGIKTLSAFDGNLVAELKFPAPSDTDQFPKLTHKLSVEVGWLNTKSPAACP